MSLLDDLKKKAQEKSALQTQDLSQTLQQHELNWHKMAPKLFIAMNYFKEMADTLNVLEPEDLCQFNLTKNFALKNLRKRNFRILKDRDGTGRTFSFRYDLIGSEEHRAAVNGQALVDKLRNMLNEEQIKFHEVPETVTRVEFVIKPKVTTSFNYVADVKNGMVNLTIKNYDGIMSQLIRYKPENLTDELLDETIKFILNQENRFLELSGFSISDDLRKKLQEKLQQSGRNRAKAPSQVQGSQKAQETQDVLDTTLNKFSSIFKK